MTFNTCALVMFVFPIICGFEIPNETLWFSNNEIPIVCCKLKIKASEVLKLNYGDKTIQGLANFAGSSTLKRLKYDEKSFLQQKNGWNFIFPENDAEKICVTKLSVAAVQEDDQMTFGCVKVDESGHGATLEEKAFVVRVYVPVSVKPFSEQLLLEEGEGNQLVCRGHGYPGLRMTWTDSDANEHVSEGFKSVEGELFLQLPPANISHHGLNYSCEVRTDYPPTENVAKASTQILIVLQPEIRLPGMTVYTTLGVTESVVFNVTGLPLPKVDCGKLQLDWHGLVDNDPRGGTHRYTVTLRNVTLDSLGHFKCRAENAYGIDEKELLFTIKPSKPEVISPAESQNSDYYLMGWQVRSREPLENVTLTLEELPSLSDDYESPAPQPRTVVYPLRPGDIDNQTTTWVGLPTEETTPLDQKWRHIVWHHLPNLSEATQHRLHLQVCNRYACHDEDEMQGRANIDSGHVFRTPRDNGTNKVDPRILSRAPVDNVYMAASLRQPTGSGHSSWRQYFQCVGLLHGLLQALVMSWILSV